MFNLNYKMKLYICFYFLFANCVREVATFPTQNECNCVLLQYCEAFNTFIDNSSSDTHIKAVIQQATCHFDGSKIHVCCPNKNNHKRNAKGKPKLDYLDELTGLNCPPSFGNELSYDEYLKTHETEPKYYYEQPQNAHFDYGEANHHHDSRVLCDEIGNCGPNTFSHDYEHPPYNEHSSHSHHSYEVYEPDSDHHLIHNDVPFFPHPHIHHHHHAFPVGLVTPKPPKKEMNDCGILPAASNSNVEVYPWITRLAYLNTTSRTIRYRCMGTIISDQYILTAAHCVDQLVQELRLISVRVGDDTNFDDYKILETIVHPNYNEPLFNNDVALLRIAITSQAKSPLIKICLPLNNSNTLAGDTGVVAGWSGSGISAHKKSSTIRYINLPIMNNTECAIRYAKYSENFETSIVITPTEFCAKAQANNDVCEGDSGGPFMERSKLGRYTLLGIVAFGPKTNCGQSNLPGVYMRVSSYVEWIESNIN